MDFKHRNGLRICPICGSILKKNGHSKNNKQRWYCKKCKKSLSPNKKLIEINNWKKNVRMFIKYLLNTSPLEFYKLNRMQFYRLSKQLRNFKLTPLCDCWSYSKVIYLDAIYFSNQCCMIARNNDYVIGWHFCLKESYYDWYEFIRMFPAPKYVVCDGGVGLMSAIKQAWPNTKHQRCLFHVFMNIRQKLTLRPETEAGVKLLKLGKSLLNIKTEEEKVAWINEWKNWYMVYKNFISERTINTETGEVWFKHKELRSAAYNLGKLILENHLFYYLEDSDVLRMNNLLEGGINSRLKQLLYFHRGCSKSIKQKIIEFYLLKRSKYNNQVIHMLYSKKMK